MKDSISKIWNSGPGPSSIKEMLILVSKGMAMGVADLIPGVSGGTIAFISGIYQSLLEAITSVNKEVVKKVVSGKVVEGLSLIHWRFLVPLLFGIALSIFGLARLMHYLINEHAILTWSTFFGLVSASIVLIGRDIKEVFTLKYFIWPVLGAVGAYFIVSMIPVETPTHLGFIFLCGVIGITAMILPGLSGSFLLLILGKYEYITAALKNPFAGENFVILSVFSLGMGTGVLSFSRVLKYCLNRFRIQTLGVLMGVLIGSMKKLWPWRQTLESKMIRGKLRILREENILPPVYNSDFVFACLCMLLGLAVIVLLEGYSQRRKKLVV